VNEYVTGIARELSVRHVLPGTVDTIYLGGGTPSRLGGSGVHALLDTVRAVRTPESNAECTIEVNPEDVTGADARQWVAAGINRVSLGVQSFNDRVLTWMHRVHDAAAARRAIHTLRDAGLTDISVDLIFAVPSELERDWERDVAQALELEPTHVSLYGLTVESGTPLGKWTARGAVLEAPEELYEREFLHAHSSLASAGFEHYEVSNYGLPNRRARHNSAYWRGVPYLGLGPSAHGFDGVERRWNTEAYAKWEGQLALGVDPVGGVETLSAENRVAESVYLGLRTSDGLLIDDSERALVRPWEEAGWVFYSPSGHLICTALGWLRLDSLASALTAHRSP
jgi:oxygen-independent coproporphyrinogen-3 oxidase